MLILHFPFIICITCFYLFLCLHLLQYFMGIKAEMLYEVVGEVLWTMVSYEVSHLRDIPVTLHQQIVCFLHTGFPDQTNGGVITSLCKTAVQGGAVHVHLCAQVIYTEIAIGDIFFDDVQSANNVLLQLVSSFPSIRSFCMMLLSASNFFSSVRSLLLTSQTALITISFSSS